MPETRPPYTHGLSPRMRGNRHVPAHNDDPQRSIPAYAGEPTSETSPTTGSRVYPRVCGGTPPVWQEWRHDQGLSPRMRGNHTRWKWCRLGLRSIPAYAGEPIRTASSPTPPEVYPRVCGGTSPASAGYHCTPGLSPRMRGNHDPQAAPAGRTGSIPAYAGEPSSNNQCMAGNMVYPRVCGGTHGGLPLWPYSNGLSPRMRGNQAAMQAGSVRMRSIPAYAGEPPAPPGGVGLCAVYPRVCGGTCYKCYKDI